MNRIILSTLFLSVFLFACNRAPIAGLVPAKGKILYDGRPIGGVSIVLTPMSDSASDRFATTVSGDDGSFELNTIGHAGALPGVYQVTLSKQTLVPTVSPEEEFALSEASRPIPEPTIIRHIPWIYEQFDTSKIVLEIDPKGSGDLLIELQPNDTPPPKRAAL